MVVACPVTLAKKGVGSEGGEFPKVTRGDLERLLRIYEYFFAVVYMWRKKKGAYAGPEEGTHQRNAVRRQSCTSWNYPRKGLLSRVPK